VPNERSDRLVRRLGFVATGEAPGPRYRMRTYALTRERWTLAPHADRPPAPRDPRV